MRAPKKGDEVRIKFWDHVQNSDEDEPIECLIYGRVHRVTKQAIALDSWANQDPNKKRDPGDGVETFTILRSAITETYVVEQWREL